MRLILFSLLLLNFRSKPKYVIVVGDICCKSCVVQLYKHLNSRLHSSSSITIGVKNHNNIIVNEMATSYYKTELPDANFALLSNATLFTVKKYPYLVKIQKNDTVVTHYDQLFIGDNVNATAFDP